MATNRRRIIARRDPKAAPHRGDSAATAITPAMWGILLSLFIGAALVVYRPALQGPFVSDDFHYVQYNSYIHELSGENLWVLLDPTGPATIAIVNYSPVQLIVHALAWQVFGADTGGHHVVNVVLHATASLLLAALLLSCGIPQLAALASGVLFLVHPANVEAVAWISQLKSSLCMVFSLAALLAWRRHPGWASALFVLALCTKATAAFALPVALLLDWTRKDRVRWRWLVLWAAVFALYSVAEFSTHQRSGAAVATLHDTPLVLMRTMAALSLRYGVMATTSWGVSAFQEPDPAVSWLDPWWLCSVPVLGLLGWRLWICARRRSIEVVFWVWVLVSYAPVSQIFPFLYPLADRYLYFILPGLLGGGLLMGQEMLERLPLQTGARTRVTQGLIGVAILLLVGGGVRSLERARIWRSGGLLVADSAANYPDGMAANLMRAKQMALGGDVEAAVAALRRAQQRGYNRFQRLETDAAYAAMRRDPRFRAVLSDMAATWIERGRHKQSPTQMELTSISHAHLIRGEYAEALAVLERALNVGGRYTNQLRTELAVLRTAIEAGHPESVRLGVPASDLF
ncbi:MAG: hypothetical protein E2O69_09070 [Deltaproteobacteria bacterium]|nr:MAG: hypothetical protein E2O69_09070 [Deltaproteobacteria bacterium]